MSFSDDAAIIEANPWIPLSSVREIARRLNVDRKRASFLKGLGQGLRPTPPALPRVLVFGDAHFGPGQDLSRATAGGRFIARNLGPNDTVVVLGDWAGVDSQCYHSTRLDLEGQRLVDDVKASNDALALLEAELGPPETQPKKVFCTGNHEYRIVRQVNANPSLEGLLGMHLFDWERRGWDVKGFLKPAYVHGVRFQHYLPSTKGAFTSDKDQARYLLEKSFYATSIVVGHHHRLDVSTMRTPGQPRRWGISAGWFGDHVEEYAGEDSNALWWNGLVLLKDVVAGDFSLELIPMDVLKRDYL